MTRKTEISHRSIIFTILFVLSLWFLYFIRDILVQFFLALLITAILNPLVTKLSKFKIPRPLSILVVYLMFFGIIGYSFAGVLPPLIDQTGSFTKGLPDFVESSGIKTFVNGELLKELLSQISRIPAQLARVLLGLFSNFIAVLTVLMFAFYLLLSHANFESTLSGFLGKKTAGIIVGITNKIEKRLGGWARGQILLMLLVGVFTYIGLLILGFPFAAPLAVLAGLFEIIPYVGPIAAAIPPVVIGFGISPFLGIASIALAFLVQQLENYVFVPKVMGKSVGLSPIVVLLALAIGFKAAGFIGIIVSIPLIIVVQELAKYYLVAK